MGNYRKKVALSNAMAEERSYRWQGHDWVFIFSSDDGLKHNVGWGAVADSLDFNYSIFVNQYYTQANGDHCYYASTGELQQLAAQGNEIGMHGYQHGRFGLDCSGDCPSQWGAFTNFWTPECWPDGLTFEEAMINFNVEVSRDSMLNWIDVEPITAAYPSHRHSDLVMSYLEQLGYLGARDGGGCWQSINFSVNPLNSWNGGISLYRIPTMASTADLWGDHWDQNGSTAQHFSVETFRAKFDSILVANNVIEDGKMFNLYTHDFGSDDNRYCDRNWHHGGLTPYELAETITYARERGAAIMSFGDAVSWYRDHTTKVVDPAAECGACFAGDLIWRPSIAAVLPQTNKSLHLEQNHPNPFNPQTDIKFFIPEPGHTSLGVYDAAGRLIVTLVDEVLAADHHQVTWDGRDQNGQNVPSGIYYCRLTGGSLRETRKMTLIR